MAWIMTWEGRGRGEDPLPPPTQRPINLSLPPLLRGTQTGQTGELLRGDGRRRQEKKKE